jgi:hypothetical protein
MRIVNKQDFILFSLSCELSLKKQIEEFVYV